MPDRPASGVAARSSGSARGGTSRDSAMALVDRVQSLDHLLDAAGGVFATMDDETPARLRAARAAP